MFWHGLFEVLITDTNIISHAASVFSLKLAFSLNFLPYAYRILTSGVTVQNGYNINSILESESCINDGFNRNCFNIAQKMNKRSFVQSWNTGAEICIGFLLSCRDQRSA
ncbi:hypothetical protein Y032_0195g1465 [Ancylostoma ceylanicum]|uniref:Uncharacterized protein n=1 Tax=Ancylostoma ceylanicum TaxID=53326 RepID=A0A016SPN6_9BILA|nr:hypothetical protein Y032_0195g1465 [Ancylostoma ceylanicum]